MARHTASLAGDQTPVAGLRADFVINRLVTSARPDSVNAPQLPGWSSMPMQAAATAPRIESHLHKFTAVALPR